MTVIRRQEAVGLRWWCDVNLDGQVLTVRQQVIDVDGELHIGRPKTKSANHRRAPRRWVRRGRSRREDAADRIAAAVSLAARHAAERSPCE